MIVLDSNVHNSFFYVLYLYTYIASDDKLIIREQGNEISNLRVQFIDMYLCIYVPNTLNERNEGRNSLKLIQRHT
jgi:hypothetical protein